MEAPQTDIDIIIGRLLRKLEDKGYSIGTDAYIKTEQLFCWFLLEKKGDSMADFALYLAPLICKNDEEQANFKLIFNAEFLPEFTALEEKIRIADEAAINEEKRLGRKKWSAILLIPAIVLIVSLLLWYMNRQHHPDIDFSKRSFDVPFYIDRNTALPLDQSIVFEDKKDTSGFDITHTFYHTGEIKKGASITKSFEHYGIDTMSVRFYSEKHKVDTTIIYPGIYVGPRHLSITPEKGDITIGESNTFTAVVDTLFMAPIAWEVDSVEVKGEKNLLNYRFTTAGNHLVAVKYVIKKDSYLGKFPEEYFTASYIQKVLAPGLQLVNDSIIPPQSKRVNKVNPTWFVISCALISVLSIALYRTVRRKRKEKLSRATGDNWNGDTPPFDLSFTSKEHNISGNYALLKLSNDLKKRVESPLSTLDIPGTISASIGNRGFLTPNFEQKLVTSEYLFLIDQAYANSQQVKLFSWLARFFIRHSVKLDFYFYYQVPDRFYKTPDSPPVSLEILKDQHYNNALIIFSDGASLIEFRLPRLKEKIMTGFAYWQNRVLVTPVPFNDWSNNEQVLSTFFKLLPADVAGLLELVRAIDAGSNAEAPLSQSKFNSYESKYIDFSDVAAIREYLEDEELFQWLCAMAVHPRIYWEIVLETGKAVVTDPQKINYVNLLKLARIRWVSEGSFSPAIRLELLKQLTKANEIRTRETMLKMLDEVPGDETAFSFEEKQLSNYTNSFVLFATGKEKYVQDQKIQEGEAKFISLYKNGSLADTPFKIYVEKSGNWETPVVSNNANTGIKDYIKDKETAELQATKNERLKHGMRIAGLLAGIVAVFVFLGYLFYKKDALADTWINGHLLLVDSNFEKDTSLRIKFYTTGCIQRSFNASKDNALQFEGVMDGSVIFRNKITPADTPFLGVKINIANYDSARTIKYRLTINGHSYETSAALAPGTHNFSLHGPCDIESDSKEPIKVFYYPQYREDTGTLKMTLVKTDFDLQIFRSSADSPGLAKRSNSVVFYNGIDRQRMHEFANLLLKAGYRLKFISFSDDPYLKNGIKLSPGSIRDDKQPVISTDSLSCLFLGENCSRSSDIRLTSIVALPAKKLKQLRACLRGYNLFDFLSAAQSPSSNRISYHRDSFRDSAQQLANCMESTFPGNKFPVVRNIVPGFNYAASIYFNNKLQAATDPEPPTIPNISIGISEEGFRTAANSLNNELVNNGIKNTSVKVRSSRTYRTPFNNEPSDDKDVLNAESLIKRVINKYFPATQYKIVYDTYLTNNVIEVFIEKIAKPKARVSKVQFPKTINVKDKFLISFDIGLENYNGVTGVHYGTIYLEGPWNSFEDFTFPGNAAARTTISKGDVGKFANLSIGKYEVRVEVKEFGLDTSLGFVTVQSAPAPVRAGYCDTVYFNIGNNGKKIYYRENAYIPNAFEGRDVTLYATENNIKFTKFNITIKGCVSQDFTVSTGETKNISLCNGKSLIIKKLDWSNTSAAFSNSAIFDVIICKPVPAGL